MPGSLQKVRRGDPLVIPAQTFNAFIDATRDFQQRQRSARRQVQRELRDTGIVLVRNESGADRVRFDVLGIEGPIIERADNETEFKQRMVLRGDIPSTPHAGKFAILLEPVADQRIVRACVHGVCLARVRMIDEAQTFADVSLGNADELASAKSGAAQLVWIEPEPDRDETDLAWCVVRIGGGGGGGPATATFAIITAKAGNSAPYRYTASGAAMDVDGNWTDAGSPTFANVFSIEEQGSGAPFTPGLVDGDVVLLFQPTPNVDAYACIRTQYRGTY